MPDMPEPPMPTKWIFLTACFMPRAFPVHRPRGPRHAGAPAPRARSAIASRFARVAPRSSGRRAFGRELVLRQVARGAAVGQVLRVVALMRGGADHQRHQHAGHAGRAQLADGDRAGAADDRVAVGQAARRHVVDERNHLRLDAARGVLGLRRLPVLLTGHRCVTRGRSSLAISFSASGSRSSLSTLAPRLPPTSALARAAGRSGFMAGKALGPESAMASISRALDCR